MSRTRRRRLTGAKSRSSGCRNNGTCPWCQRGRVYKTTKRAGLPTFRRASERIRQPNESEDHG